MRSPNEHDRYADQLARGEQIQNVSHQHKGMAALKARLGDPRPSGATLSLTSPWGPSTYWGYDNYRGKRVPYRLSTDPSDFAWENQYQNGRRGRPTVTVENMPHEYRDAVAELISDGVDKFHAIELVARVGYGPRTDGRRGED